MPSKQPLKLVIANKAYSSWSLRPWLLMAHLHIPFEETVIDIYADGAKKKLLRHAPTGKAPVLYDGDIRVWESLAIVEYLAEAYPDKGIWPKNRAARAHARAICSEMHAGFMAMRQQLPTNFRRPPKARAVAPDMLAKVMADVARIEAMWADARKRFGKGGPFLFGRFSAADAMFAPVVNRLHSYDIEVKKQTRAYMDAVMALPAWVAWHVDAAKEKRAVPQYDEL